MSRIGFAMGLLSAAVSVLAVSPAQAGGHSAARLWAERQAALSAQQNEASVGQNDSENASGRTGQDESFVRSRGRGGRMTLRADQADAQNAVTIDQHGGGNVAGIRQFGRDLNAVITQDGNGNSATIRQWGRGGAATISQTGDGNAACLIQIGRNVNTQIVQTGGQNVGIIQTRQGSREVPLELCTQASDAPRRVARDLWRR